MCIKISLLLLLLLPISSAIAQTDPPPESNLKINSIVFAAVSASFQFESLVIPALGISSLGWNGINIEAGGWADQIEDRSFRFGMITVGFTGFFPASDSVTITGRVATGWNKGHQTEHTVLTKFRGRQVYFKWGYSVPINVSPLLQIHAGGMLGGGRLSTVHEHTPESAVTFTPDRDFVNPEPIKGGVVGPYLAMNWDFGSFRANVEGGYTFHLSLHDDIGSTPYVKFGVLIPVTKAIGSHIF